jgi:hypothetical protein
VFDISSGSAEFRSAVADYIDTAIFEWSKKYDIAYRTKLVKNQFRVTFDNDKHYSFFATTWNPEFSIDWLEYQLIEPMKIDKHQ